MSSMLLKMSVLTLCICLITVAIKVFDDKVMKRKFSPFARSITIGVLYGALAMLSTHKGINYGSMVLNVRDLAPLSAGVFFDPLAGIFAGTIGAIDRYVAGTYLGLGSYTTIACCLSTLLAGIVSALFNKYLFEGKKPSFFYSFTIGALMEVFHMLAVLLTHMEDIVKAFEVVRTIAAPMIVFTALGLAFSSLLLYLPKADWKKDISKIPAERVPVTKSFQMWLLIFVTAVFVMTFIFSYKAQTSMTVLNMQSTMETNIRDIKSELQRNRDNLGAGKAMLKKQGLSVAYSLADNIEQMGGVSRVDSEYLVKKTDALNLYEIDVIDKNGIICASSNPDYVGFDMASGEQSAAFLVLLSGRTDEFIQDFQPIAYDKNISVMYVGVKLKEGFIQIGYNKDNIAQVERLSDISQVAAKRHIGTSGNIYILKDDIVVSSSDQSNGKTLSELVNNQDVADGRYFSTSINGVPSYCLYKIMEGYGIILTVSNKEMYMDRDIFAYETALAEILLFAVIFVLTYFLVKKIIVNNLERVNDSLAKITGGNLDEVVNVRTSVEFTSLSEDINSTVKTLKHYISEAENRINAELEFAREIQFSALPGVFPPFPDHDEFDLYASMTPAKEVGGDFYDFFFTDEGHMALVIADVSGKGIPAALFMMKSKTLIKSLAETGASASEILRQANVGLCDGNDAEMFVTAWIGLYDLATGTLQCANAGHEYPAVYRAGKGFELYKDKHGMVLGAMDMGRYKEYTIELKAGDRIFVYTDGVTEATNANTELFGTDRLEEALNKNSGVEASKFLASMKNEIDGFVGKAQQFDDITMLYFSLRPKKNVSEEISKQFSVGTETVENVLDMAEEFFSKNKVSIKTVTAMNVSIDEIVSNVVNHSVATFLQVSCQINEEQAVMTFSDNGKPYDPMKREDPDVTLPSNEREIGGLGIFLIKKLMDQVSYEYRDETNHLTIRKKI